MSSDKMSSDTDWIDTWAGWLTAVYMALIGHRAVVGTIP